MEELKRKIDIFIDISGTKSFRWLYKEINESKKLLEILHSNISKNLIDKPIAQKLYHFYYQIPEIPKCRQCSKEIVFVTFSRAYGEFCDRKCSSLYQSENKELAIEKRKKTVKEKYGVDYVMQSDSVKKTYIENSIEKYGVDWVSKSDEVKKTITETWANKEDKKEIDEKRYNNLIKSIRKKYNDDTLTSVFSLDFVVEKKKDTCLENNGVLYPFQNKRIREKYKKTCIERYGYENAMSNDLIQKKQFISAFNFKNFTLDSGKQIKVQGDSIIVLPILLEKYKEDDIDIEFECNTVEYYENNKKHFYRPDFYIKSENKFIEVKSTYYLSIVLSKNIAKFNHTLNAGYNLELYLTNSNKNIIIFDFKETKISMFLKELGISNIIYGSNNILLLEKNIMINIIKNKEDQLYLDSISYNFKLKSSCSIDFLNIDSALIENNFEDVKNKLINILK